MIRQAVAADQVAIEAIVEAAYGPYVARIGRKPGPMLDDYAAQIASGGTHVLEAQGRVVGFIILLKKPGALLLDNVAVAPASHGRGFGAALLRFAEATAREAGLPAITLYTHVTMVENIALYQRIGYVETHRAVESGLHRVYLTKVLPPAMPG
jgi:ribosomal protein S18 acetylase RimI-like enzyme